MRLRFAPSPTGFLHVGNARTALVNWLLARGGGGTFVLRIEDSDRERSTVEAERAIIDDLRWLGLDWDEGPDIGGERGPYRQSERLAHYQAHAARLLEQGAAYYCFCSPAELESERQRALAAGLPPKYGGTCRSIAPAEAAARVAAGEAAAVRFRVVEGREVTFEDRIRGAVTVNTDIVGDPVLLRSDGHPAYNFAVVIDDALMEITDVVRGEDHISNTTRQVLIYEALKYPQPSFAHLSLVLGPDHTPLSKRHGATSVAEFRARGYLPEALVNYLALLGWSPGGGDELLPAGELARRFSLDAVSHSAGVFDEAKLAWVNRHYLKQAEPDRLAELLVPFLQAAGLAKVPGAEDLEWLGRAMPLVSGSVDRLDQAVDRLALVFRFDAASALSRAEVHGEFEDPGAREVARALADDLASASRLVDRGTFRAAAERVRARTGRKGRALFHPIRVALTGATEGPELDLLVPAIDTGASLAPGSGLSPIVGCRERARAFVEALG